MRQEQLRDVVVLEGADMKSWVVAATLVAAVICGLRLWMPAPEDGQGDSPAIGGGNGQELSSPEAVFPSLRRETDTAEEKPLDQARPAASTDAPRSAELDAALAVYRQGKHAEAARLLAPLVERGVGLPGSRVFLAAAALESGDYATARAAAGRAAAEGEAASWRIEGEALKLHCDLREGSLTRAAVLDRARARLAELANSPSGRLLLQDLVDRSVADNAGADGVRLAQAAIEQVARSVQGQPAFARVRGLAASLEKAERAVLFDRRSTVWATRAKIGTGEPLVRLVTRLRKESQAGRYDAHFLAWVNGIADPGRVQAGRELVIPPGDLAIEVFRGSRLVLVYCGEYLVRVHGCAIGRTEKPTPVGSFEIGEKIERPVWHGPNGAVAYAKPENPLGEGWLGFVDRPDATGYGIHGTNDEGSIGEEASEGCVRLYNAAIVELMAWVAPKGTQVTIH
ncbi:MAG: L,D-transpeptidase [Planctomycetes bacterium]|nr:L,D-transpeptidase [Planctomycetota bacterium]